MENIHDSYCERCKNRPFACTKCEWNMSESFALGGTYAFDTPTKFEPKKTIENPYEKFFNEKIFNYNINWFGVTANIRKIIFSGPATIVLWQDGGKTIVKYHKEKGCMYRKDIGVLYCIIKHHICLDSSTQFHKLLKTIDVFCEAENGDKTT